MRNLLRNTVVLCLAALLALSAQTAHAGTNEMVNVIGEGVQGNGGCMDGDLKSITANGRYIVISSNASNFVPHTAFSGWNVFLRDRLLETTEAVRLDSEGNMSTLYDAIPLSAAPDGRYITF